MRTSSSTGAGRATGRAHSSANMRSRAVKSASCGAGGTGTLSAPKAGRSTAAPRSTQRVTCSATAAINSRGVKSGRLAAEKALSATGQVG